MKTLQGDSQDGQMKAVRIVLLAIFTIAFMLVIPITIVAVSKGGWQAKELKAQPSVSAVVSEPKTETITEYEDIDFISRTIEDPNYNYGETYVATAGIKGQKALVYEVTYDEDGKETERKLVNENIVREPVEEVVAVGTRIAWYCVDTTSYDRNAYNDNYCVSSTGAARYVSDSQARNLDPGYIPGQAGAYYYNSR